MSVPFIKSVTFVSIGKNNIFLKSFMMIAYTYYGALPSIP